MFPEQTIGRLLGTMALAVLLWSGCGLLAVPAIAGVAVEAVRFGKDPDRSGTGKIRVVFDLTAMVPFSSRVAADRRTLIVSLTGIDWHPPSTLALHGVGPLVAYHFEPESGTVGQVTIQADQPIRILGSGKLAPQAGTRFYRIIIDLAPDPTAPSPATTESEPMSGSVPPPTPNPTPEPAAPAPVSTVPVTTSVPTPLPAPESALDRGIRAATGHDGPPDFSSAAEAFRAAAIAGSPQGAFNLGELYRGGRGVPQDYRQAAQWFAKSAETGFAPAQFYLAVLMFNGVGVVRDQRQATELLTKAAVHGLPQAQRALDDLRRAAGAKGLPVP